MIAINRKLTVFKKKSYILRYRMRTPCFSYMRKIKITTTKKVDTKKIKMSIS